MLDSKAIVCPYCGEQIELLFELLDTVQTYYEDCQVCCQPIYVEIMPDADTNSARIRCLQADETP